jgi:hypothetical protein
MAYFVVQGVELNPFTGRPDQSLPGGGNYPSQGLPGVPGYPSQGLPGVPGYPSQGLPGSPGYPSTGFPPALPGQGLPWAPVHPDQGLPGQGGYPSGQPIPGGPTATPYGSAVASAPPASVDPTKGGWLLVSVQGHGLIWAWGQPPAAPPAGTKPTPPTQPKA